MRNNSALRRATDVQGMVRRLVDLVFALALLLYTAQMEIPFLSATLENGERRESFIPMNTLLYIATAMVVWTRWRSVAKTASRMRWLLALLGWALLSTLWSTRPTETLHLAISLTLTTLSGIYLAVAFRPKQQVTLIGIVAGMIIAISVLKIGLGSSAFQHHAFRGAFTTKNEMGRLIVLAILALQIAPGDLRKRSLRWLALAGLAVLLLLTKSATALAIGCIVIVLIPLLRIARIRGPMLLPALLLILSILVGAATFAIKNTEAVFAVLDRDTTMTGRTELWKSVTLSIEKRPWLGYGLGGFWNGLTGPSLEVLRVVRWKVPHAHNGFLELALNLGLIGLAIFLVSFVATLLRGLKQFRYSTNPYLAWPLAFMSYMFLYNMTETTIVRVASIFWILYVTAAASIARQTSGSSIETASLVMELRGLQMLALPEAQILPQQS